jgi:hypothetical protein
MSRRVARTCSTLMYLSRTVTKMANFVALTLSFCDLRPRGAVDGDRFRKQEWPRASPNGLRRGFSIFAVYSVDTK